MVFLERVVSGESTAPSDAGLRALVVETLDIVARRKDFREIYDATELLSGLRGDWPARVAFRLLKPLGPGGSLALVARARDERWTVPSGRKPGVVDAVLKRWFSEVEALPE